MGDWLTAMLVGGIVGLGVAPLILVFAWLPMRRKSEGDEVTVAHRMAILRNTALAIVAVVIITSVGFMVLKKDAPADTGMPGMAMPSAPHVPYELAGVPLVQTLTGDQALQQIASIHQSDISVVDAVIGYYKGGGHEATVWASVTPAAEMARLMDQQMAEAIGGGNTPFSAPEQISGGVWKVEGMGQVHYFFAAGNGVWWVSADPRLAERSLAQTEAAAGL